MNDGAGSALEAAEQFQEFLYSTQSLCVPHRSVTLRVQAAPWMTPALLRLVRDKQILLRKSKRTGKTEDYQVVPTS